MWRAIVLPNDPVPRLEELLEDDLLAELETAALYASAESFCEDKCRLDDHCPIEQAIDSRHECPLWKYIRSRPRMP